MPDEPYQPKYLYRQEPPREHPTAYRAGDLPLAALQPTWSIINDSSPVDFPPQVYNNNCVGMATAYLIASAMIARGEVDPGFWLSTIMPWNGAKQIEGSIGQNTGVFPHDALTYTRNAGICRYDLLPQRNATADASAMPDNAASAEAAARKNIEFYQATSFDEFLQTCTTLNTPGMMTIQVYPSFENPHPDGTVDNFTGTLLGYHEIDLLAYDHSSPDQNAWTYVIQNWWQENVPKRRYILTRPQLMQVWAEGWGVKLWPYSKPQPAPTPDPAQFVPSGPSAGFWAYVMTPEIQACLNAGWGAWFRKGGCA